MKKLVGNAIVGICDYMENDIMTESIAKNIVDGIAQNKFVFTLIGETEIIDLEDSSAQAFFEAAIASQDVSIQHDLRVMFGLA